MTVCKLIVKTQVRNQAVQPRLLWWKLEVLQDFMFTDSDNAQQLGQWTGKVIIPSTEIKAVQVGVFCLLQN